MCTYGLYDEIITDPGSNFCSNLYTQLNAWLGIRRVYSLVDVHESNGVERTGGETLRHLRALVNDERLKDRWSNVEVLSLIEFALNSRQHSEAPYTPFELRFGTEDAKYFNLPDEVTPESLAHEWLKSLNADLKVVRDITQTFQQDLIKERLAGNDEPECANQFQPGDLVLYDSLYDPCRYRTEKLQSRYKGPYEVISQQKDEVEVRHLALGFITKLLVERIGLFIGSREEAYALAMEDADQFVVSRIINFRGDPAKRKSLEFLLEFLDGDRVWKVLDADLSGTQQFEAFCRANKEVYFLLYTAKLAQREFNSINKQPISSVAPGDTVYVPLRFFNYTLYDQIDLPNKDTVTYVVQQQYTRWCGRNQLRIDARVPVFQSTYERTNVFVFQVGNNRDLSPDMVVVTEQLIQQYPAILDFIADRAAYRRVKAHLNL